MAQQPRRELAPAFPTTRTRDATFQAHAKFTEIRLHSFLRLQSLQSGTIAHQPRHLQVDTQRRSCRVASTLFRIGSRFPRQTETGSNSSDSTPASFKYFKTSPDIIRLAVTLYIRFPLSLRNVEDLLHERCIDVSHETVRYWWNRFGPMFAAEIRKRRVQKL